MVSSAVLNYPFISHILYQAKRRNAGGKNVGSGEEEGCCENVLGQEFAELLGQAMTQIRYTYEGNVWADQEAFVINIHGTRLKITAAHFSEEYLKAVNSNTMPISHTQWLRRTYSLDLRKVQDRIEALRWLFGLLRYLHSGEAEISFLKMIM